MSTSLEGTDFDSSTEFSNYSENSSFTSDGSSYATGQTEISANEVVEKEVKGQGKLGKVVNIFKSNYKLILINAAFLVLSMVLLFLSLIFFISRSSSSVEGLTYGKRHSFYEFDKQQEKVINQGSLFLESLVTSTSYDSERSVLFVTEQLVTEGSNNVYDCWAKCLQCEGDETGFDVFGTITSPSATEAEKKYSPSTEKYCKAKHCKEYKFSECQERPNMQFLGASVTDMDNVDDMGQPEYHTVMWQCSTYCKVRIGTIPSFQEVDIQYFVDMDYDQAVNAAYAKNIAWCEALPRARLPDEDDTQKLAVPELKVNCVEFKHPHPK